MRRRVLSVLVVAFMVGCTYDWTLGGETLEDEVNEPPGGSSGGSSRSPAPISDAGRPETTSPTTPAGGEECGPDCVCDRRERCEFTCTRGRCVARCLDESTCSLRCAPGATCVMDCSDRAACDMDCSAGQATCSLWCDDVARCSAQCRNGSICSGDCATRCSIDCAGGGLCF